MVWRKRIKEFHETMEKIAPVLEKLLTQKRDNEK